MKTISVFARALLFSAIVPVVGCASIISGRHAEVTINSVPSYAHVTVRDKRGRAIANAVTPATIELKRNDRIIFPARYTATIEAPGFQPANVPINSTVNPWILGNVVLGGIPGLIVDGATGAVWMPRHADIDQQLAPICTAQRPPRAPHTSGPSTLQTGYDVEEPFSGPSGEAPTAYLPDQPLARFPSQAAALAPQNDAAQTNRVDRSTSTR